MLTHNCRFPQGMIVLVAEDDQEVQYLVHDFILEEEVMGHTFQVMNDTEIDVKKLNDSGYYSAAILAARVKVEGIRISPEMILELHSDDGKYLLATAAALDERRDEFRKEIKALPERHHPPKKAGV